MAGKTTSSAEIKTGAGRFPLVHKLIQFADIRRHYKDMREALIASIAQQGAGTLGRVKRALDLFMVFPYAAPGYDMAYVDEGPGVVGFDVWRCPAAELFEAHGLSALCKEAFCDLDYPLADMWGVELERTHTLSTGGPCCNFRFRDKPTELASKSRGTPEDKT